MKNVCASREGKMATAWIDNEQIVDWLLELQGSVEIYYFCMTFALRLKKNHNK